jgi:16S rRNA (guanine527-N7)-methyltransferase
VEQRDELSRLLKHSVEEFGLALEAPVIKLFIDYLMHLKRWNRTTNLTSITQDEEIIIKHFIDSLAILRAEPIKQGASMLDVGTGAGFPGIPLKIVRPDLLITLVEPVHKKVSFLRFVIGFFRFNGIRVFEGTIEQFVSQPASIEAFDYITTRALRYEFLLSLCGRLLKNDGKVILYLSEPLPRLTIPENFSISHEYQFELPRKFGKRVISILSASV